MLKMPSKAFRNRCTAFSLSELTFAENKLVADKHYSDCMMLDELFYEQLLTSVENNFNLYYPPVYGIFNGNWSPTSIKPELLKNVTEMVKEVDRHDTPVKVKDHFKDDIAKFVLCGEVRYACIDNCKLTFETHTALCKDVYDRYYTLLERGYI